MNDMAKYLLLGGVGGALAALVLCEAVVPGIVAAIMAHRRALAARGAIRGEYAETVSALARVGYRCRARGCCGDVQAVGESLTAKGWHEHACDTCGKAYVLRQRYPFTTSLRTK